MLGKRRKKIRGGARIFQMQHNMGNYMVEKSSPPYRIEKQAHVAGACGAKREMLWDESGEVNKGYVKL